MSPLKTHNHFMKKYFSSFNNYCTQKTKESQSYVFHPKPGLTSFGTNRIFFIKLKKKLITLTYHSIPLVFLNCLLQLLCLFWVSLPVEYSGSLQSRGRMRHMKPAVHSGFLFQCALQGRREAQDGAMCEALDFLLCS